MCWSGEASAVLAVTGFATAAYVSYKKEPMPLWMTLGYFSLMEALQAFTYVVINQCTLPSNQIATILRLSSYCFSAIFYKYVCVLFFTRSGSQKA